MTVSRSLKRGLHALSVEQAAAVAPTQNIWLSASAGTGKTQVLTARVIRLLLEDGVKPENLLSITFTKTGAAEMAERINNLLASWVQMKGSDLAQDLIAIGADHSPATQNRARRLFASVLDAPGGGLQILTIHSLCQSLLASFPEEAGLVAGFELVEGREQAELYRQSLAEMITAAEQDGQDWLIAALQQLSLDMGEDRAQKFLQRCAAAPHAMAEIPNDTGARIFVRRHLGLDYDEPIAEILLTLLDDSVINRANIIAIAEMNAAWGGKRGSERAAKIYEWLAMAGGERAQNFAMLHGFWSKGDGDPLIASRGYTPLDEAYSEIALGLYNWTSALLTLIRIAEYTERLAPALLAGKAFAARYQENKRARGLVDFGDMIRKAADLLRGGGVAEWVRYKLDQQIDHILIDEAQDTNNAQWDIVRALADDFFSGNAAKGEVNRTIFAVGDYKQAIFGFQGTDPENYRQAGAFFGERIKLSGKELQRIALSRSFRSTRPVLDFVNAVIKLAGPETFGIHDPIEAHFSEISAAGTIELFAPVTAGQGGENEDGDAAGAAAPAGDISSLADEDEESWLSSEKRILAHRIAAYVRKLIDEAPMLAARGRRLVAGDIMILLRSRGETASFLVGQLHDKNVPVAGIDRLRLQQPLAVQDMLSVVRFVLQPGDDLSLACILVSPLIGWSQDDLLQHGYRGPSHKGKNLWQFLRIKPELAGDVALLSGLLNQADYVTVYDFLEHILSGAIAGRKKFTARLGRETLVPIEELLNAAMQFEQSHGGGLQSFLDWFERGDTEIKREGLASANEVRVMTVHGAKGLQAPVVILADVTADPDAKKDRDFSLSLKNGEVVPLLPINKADKHGMLEKIAQQQETADRQEHHRLLYVAMTRAEERLVMAGSIGDRARNRGASEQSWFALIERAMQLVGCVYEADALWTGVMRYCGASPLVPAAAGAKHKPETAWPSLPPWLLSPAPEEQSPPRPLVPSHLDDDDYGEAPVSNAMRRAADKGRLIHAVFERISGEDTAHLLKSAGEWLQMNNKNPAIDNDAILADVAAVITNPEWSVFFGPNARAEVPLAAVVGSSVITGRIDRLNIGPDHIHILDFKTGRNVPRDPANLPRAFLRQMAHYVAAVEMIFPGKCVKASLLFTHIPILITLPPELLDPHRPAA